MLSAQVSIGFSSPEHVFFDRIHSPISFCSLTVITDVISEHLSHSVSTCTHDSVFTALEVYAIVCGIHLMQLFLH